MFLPSPGPLEVFLLPEPGDGLRIDTGFRAGDRITPHYDPLIVKLISHGADRDQTISRALRALRASAIEGIHSNVPFLIRTLEHPAFRAGEIDTGFVGTHGTALVAA
jgi:acetyl/propionyl-CoA carboxylase alpha subunit